MHTQDQSMKRTIDTLNTKYDKLLSELEAITHKEVRKWHDDRGYEDYIAGDSCCRGFFEDTRAARTFSYMKKARVPHGPSWRHTSSVPF